MSDCEKYFDLLNMLADGELSAEEERELRSHIDTCPDCRRIYEAISFVSDVSAEAEEAPPELHGKIMSGIRREMQAKHRRRRAAIGSLAACLVVLVGAGSILLSPMGSSSAKYAAAGAVPAAAPMAIADASESVEAPMAEPEEFSFEAAYDAERGAGVYLTPEELTELVAQLLAGNNDTENTVVAVSEGTEYVFTNENGVLQCSAAGGTIEIRNIEEFTAFMEDLK